LGIPQQTIAGIIDVTEKRHLSEFGKNFTPFIYNIWNLQKQDNAKKIIFFWQYLYGRARKSVVPKGNYT